MAFTFQSTVCASEFAFDYGLVKSLEDKFAKGYSAGFLSAFLSGCSDQLEYAKCFFGMKDPVDEVICRAAITGVGIYKSSDKPALDAALLKLEPHEAQFGQVAEMIRIARSQLCSSDVVVFELVA